MKFLYLLRHAKSSWDDPSLKDHDRPLNLRGFKTAPLMGRLAAEKGYTFDAILSSPATRARQTAEMFAREAKFPGKIEIVPAFYPGEPDDYYTALSEVRAEAEKIVVVGHNPGMENLLTLLTGQRETMPTGTLAQVRLPIKDWKNLTYKTKGSLLQIYKPKELFKDLSDASDSHH